MANCGILGGGGQVRLCSWWVHPSGSHRDLSLKLCPVMGFVAMPNLP